MEKAKALALELLGLEGKGYQAYFYKVGRVRNFSSCYELT